MPVQIAHLDCNDTGLWELQQVVAEVLHPLDVDSYIGRPVESLDQSPSPVVHADPGNDLEVA